MRFKYSSDIYVEGKPFVGIGRYQQVDVESKKESQPTHITQKREKVFYFFLF